MTYPCEMNDLPAQPALSIRTRTPVADMPQALGRAYGAIITHLTGIGEAPSGPPFVCYYNMDMQDLDIEIGFPVARELPGKGEIQANVIPAGKHVSCLYTGPYEYIPQAYEALAQYIQEKGFTPTGLAYEYYLNEPAETPAQELQTRIVFPLQV